MYPNERTIRAHHEARHAHLLAAAERHRALRAAAIRPTRAGDGVRVRIAALLRGLASRVEPRGRGRLA